MTQILFPVGRLLNGSTHILQAQIDRKTKLPKLDKNGQPAKNINFRVAIPKTQPDWRLEPWGRLTHAVGKSAQALCDQMKDFAWKIRDGDSSDLNSKLKPYNTVPGYAGHWVVSFQQSWAPKHVTADGATELPGDKFVPGYYVQMFVDVTYNNSTESPGIYMNPIAVALAGIGEVLAVDVDTTSVGFGGGPLPAGATAVPVAAAAFAGAAPSAPPAPAATVVQPNTAFMTAPAAPAAPAVPAAPPAPRVPVKTMTAKAGGATYEQFKVDPAWTDELLVQHGYMVIA